MIDALTGSGAGSIAAGQPVISYQLGGELLSSGVSLIGLHRTSRGMGYGWYCSPTS